MWCTNRLPCSPYLVKQTARGIPSINRFRTNADYQRGRVDGFDVIRHLLELSSHLSLSSGVIRLIFISEFVSANRSNAAAHVVARNQRIYENAKVNCSASCKRTSTLHHSVAARSATAYTTYRPRGSFVVGPLKEKSIGFCFGGIAI